MGKAEATHKNSIWTESLSRCYTRLLRPSHSLQDGFLRSKKMAKSKISISNKFCQRQTKVQGEFRSIKLEEHSGTRIKAISNV